MVLAEYLDNQKKGEGKDDKDDIETFLNLVEFPLLNQITPISLFQLHRMISRIGQYFPVYGRLSMVPVVPVVFSLNFLH